MTSESPRSKFVAMRNDLSKSLIERGPQIDIALTALVSRDHALFIGSPGTAKSMLIDALVSWMSCPTFSILLTKFTAPEELFGPISVKGMQNDKFYRLFKGMMPEAVCVYVDEVFKSSSAVLNTLLRIMNERKFRNGTEGDMTCPLRTMFGASNEWPNSESGKELSAVFDRFLFRNTVEPIKTQAGLRALLWSDDLKPKLTTSLTLEELDQAAEEARKVTWTPEATDALHQIIKRLTAEGINPGDRRKRKVVGAVQAFAYISGSSTADPEHLEIACSTLWDDPLEQPTKVAQIVAEIANPVGMALAGYIREIEQILSTTNARDLGQATAASKKLKNISKELGKLESPKQPRVAQTREYVKTKLAELSRDLMASTDD